MTGNIVRGPVGLSDGQKVYAGQPSRFVTLTQGGQRVAFTGNHHRILVFEVVYIGDSKVTLSPLVVLGGHTSYITNMALSWDGQLLATTSHDLTVRIWDIQTAAKHKQAIIDSASDTLELANINEAFIDDDGWATCPSSRGGPPLRLMWIPETQRQSLYFPISVCEVVSYRQKETQLNLNNFFHGKNWVICKT